MKHLNALVVVAVLVAGCSQVEPGANRPAAPEPSLAATDEKPVDADLLRYRAFVATLDTRGLAKDYPGPLRDLDASDPNRRRIALNVLGASESVAAVPYIVPWLDSSDVNVRVYAGFALQRIVSAVELKRRYRGRAGPVALRPRTPEDLDLRPMRWVVLKMLRSTSDDGSTQSYAATMAAYIGFKDMGEELRRLLKNRHPGVARSARHALRVMNLLDEKSPEPLALEE